jgi:hypothetical protein
MNARELIEQLAKLPTDTPITVWDAGEDEEAHAGDLFPWTWGTVQITPGALVEKEHVSTGWRLLP